jgi:hypothetical protein
MHHDNKRLHMHAESHIDCTCTQIHTFIRCTCSNSGWPRHKRPVWHCDDPLYVFMHRSIHMDRRQSHQRNTCSWRHPLTNSGSECSSKHLINEPDKPSFLVRATAAALVARLFVPVGTDNIIKTSTGKVARLITMVSRIDFPYHAEDQAVLEF